MRRQQAGILALLEEADNMSPAVHRGYGQRRGQGLIVVRGEDDDAAGADNPGALQISRGGKAAGPYITDPLVAMRELIPRKKDELLRGRRVGHQRVDRKSVVWGKSVSVRVDIGGRRIMKKKKNENRM